MQRKVVIVTTGGTIAMRYDREKNGAAPAVSGRELLEAAPPLRELCPLEVREFSNIPSCWMTPRRMRDLALVVEEALAEEGVAGVVVTHGTDALEESAYFLDLFLASDKPVCVTGAMRNAGDISPDGPHNLICAVRAALSPECRGRGTLVIMNSEIHAARAVTKMHTGNVAAFASPFWGPLGYVDEDVVILRRAPLDRTHLRPEEPAWQVPILKTYTGMDGVLLDALAATAPDGLIVEGFGRGNVPPEAVPALRRLLEDGLPVVVTSRVPGGRALDVYGAEGAGAHLKSLGAVLGGEHSSQKARLKLMLALGLTRDRAALAALFASV
ncbi:MAG: asparaginase [Desulfovibrionaceae bacterium]|nr:asparaginase [Desulfovibrionaceae bacterium]